MSTGTAGGGGAAAAGGAGAGASSATVPTSAQPTEVKQFPKGAAPDKEKSKKPPEKGAAAGGKSAEAESEWGEKDDAELFERLKKAPWAKVKANGEEKRITSREEFLALATDASRSRGMNRLAEQTKKEQAEAKAASEEAKQIKQALEAARRGDQRALRDLGLIPDTERAELEKKWKDLPPEVQETYRRNFELQQELDGIRTKEERAKQDEAEKQKKLRQEKTLGAAREHLSKILADVKEDLRDVELPEIIGAMHSLLKTGQRIGVDYDEAMLSAYVQQRREASLHSRYGAMKPDAAVRLALPHLKALVSTPEGLAQLEQALGIDFEGVFKPIADHRLKKWKASKTKDALKPPAKGAGGDRDEERKDERTPLSPFRFTAR